MTTHARTMRRQFIKTSSAATTAIALAGALSAAKPGYTAENNTIKVALVGCGGRGTGAAAQALSTQGPVKLHAMSDVFPNKIQNTLNALKNKHAAKLDVPPDRQFVGFDGYKKAIDSLDKGDLVLLATPPAFRPLHVEYAIEKGIHVFMEKSMGVDAPGVRRILKAGELAKTKNLKIAGGLMSRHSVALNAAMDRIHNGEIGELITCWAYRVHHPVGFKARAPKMNELMHQVNNYSCYTWLNGSFLLDWLIHNLDVCCWAKDAWPVSAQGQGGRQVRTDPDQLFDHYAVEYTFADGTRLFGQGRHMDKCWGFFGDVLHGTKGSAHLGEGVHSPRLFKGYKQTTENLLWEYSQPYPDSYQVEHDLLFQAIRDDKPYNESERCAYATLVGILGRMASESGQSITWEQALNSNLELAPDLAKLTLDSEAPVKPDAQGNYPVAMPGMTKAF